VIRHKKEVLFDMIETVKKMISRVPMQLVFYFQSPEKDQEILFLFLRRIFSPLLGF